MLYYLNTSYINLYLIINFKKAADTDLVIVHWCQSKHGKSMHHEKISQTHININTLHLQNQQKSLITIFSFIWVEYLCYITITWNQLALHDCWTTAYINPSLHTPQFTILHKNPHFHTPFAPLSRRRPISLTFTAGSVGLCGVYSSWSVCEVVVVPYVVSVVHVCMLRNC